MWTGFHDCHSGGGTKLPPFERIYIEAPKDEACRVFYNRFGRNPHKVSCTCCGNDYSVSEHASLEQLTGYDRGCQYLEGLDAYVESFSNESWANKYVPQWDYLGFEHVKVIYAKDIKDEERVGELPQQGYVWAGG